MDNDFKHFASKIKKRVKDKGPARLLQTPENFIILSGTIQPVGFDFDTQTHA